MLGEVQQCELGIAELQKQGPRCPFETYHSPKLSLLTLHIPMFVAALAAVQQRKQAIADMQKKALHASKMIVTSKTHGCC